MDPEMFVGAITYEVEIFGKKVLKKATCSGI